jgi:hypothetical protein
MAVAGEGRPYEGCRDESTKVGLTCADDKAAFARASMGE